MAKKIQDQHADFLAAKIKWERNRAVSSGEDAVKAAGVTYLPKPSGLSDQEYSAYKERASFYPATGRTVDAYTGLINLTPPVVNAPAAIVPFFDDINLQGLSLNGFAEKVVEEVVIVGRGGVLVDMPIAPEGEHTVAEREAMNLRPFFSFYPAETIVDWRVGRVNGRTQLSFVKLFERVPVEIDFLQEAFAEQYRILWINDLGEYEVVVFREAELEGGGTEWVEYERRVPMVNGESEREIPFVFLGSRDASPEIQSSPINDLVSVNLQHYRNSADYENGLHWTGSPTPIFSGEFVTVGGEEVTKVRIGSSSGIHLTQGSDAKFLEFQGSGLEPLSTAMQHKEAQMALLGSRVLAAERKQTETAEAAEIHRAGESSVLSSLANAISKGLQRALKIMARWNRSDGDVVFKLNTDFVPQRMSAQDIQGLLLAWQGGAISKLDLFEQFQEGEVIRDGITFEEHEAELEAEAPDVQPLKEPAVPPKDAAV